MEKFLNKGETRTPCKYGDKCYQKNPEHHKRFKHPKKNDKNDSSFDFVTKDSSKITECESDSQNEKFAENESSPPAKKLKPDEDIQDFTQPKASAVINEDLNDSSDDSEILPASPLDVKENLKQKFLVDFPQDFYDFWQFCQTISTDKPEDALDIIGLKLVGPFDVLSGKLKDETNRKLNSFLCHWRFYYDPPEFQTLLCGSSDEFHIGYFRDDPSEDPIFLASMSSLKPGIIQPMKENIFATVKFYMESNACKADKEVKKSLLEKIISFSESKEYDLSGHPSSRLTKRKKAVVTKAFHGAGIVVPLDKETEVGYREIPETQASLKKILRQISDAETESERERKAEALQELVTNVQWANDEGDVGMGLELGLNVFCFGCPHLHSYAEHLLTVAYELLGRQTFVHILKAHLKNRRKADSMNLF